MKNKAIHDMVKQLHYDVRTSEENVQRLCNDLIRVERQFAELWTFVYKHQGDLAEKPELQTLKCTECNKYSKDYQIEQDAEGYVKMVVCKQCLIERENENASD